MLATLDSDQVRVRRVGEQFDLLLRVLDRVYRVARALTNSLVAKCCSTFRPSLVDETVYGGNATTYVQPHHRAYDVRQSPVQSIPLSQIDRRHPRSSPARVTPVVTLNGLLPEIPDAAVAVSAEPDVNQEIAERVLGFKIGSLLGGGPVVDGTGACIDAVPTAEFACAFRLVVH